MIDTLYSSKVPYAPEPPKTREPSSSIANQSSSWSGWILRKLEDGIDYLCQKEKEKWAFEAKANQEFCQNMTSIAKHSVAPALQIGSAAFIGGVCAGPLGAATVGGGSALICLAQKTLKSNVAEALGEGKVIPKNQRKVTLMKGVLFAISATSALAHVNVSEICELINEQQYHLAFQKLLFDLGVALVLTPLTSKYMFNYLSDLLYGLAKTFHMPLSDEYRHAIAQGVTQGGNPWIVKGFYRVEFTQILDGAMSSLMKVAFPRPISASAGLISLQNGTYLELAAKIGQIKTLESFFKCLAPNVSENFFAGIYGTFKGNTYADAFVDVYNLTKPEAYPCSASGLELREQANKQIQEHTFLESSPGSDAKDLIYYHWTYEPPARNYFFIKIVMGTIFTSGPLPICRKKSFQVSVNHQTVASIKYEDLLLGEETYGRYSLFLAWNAPIEIHSILLKRPLLAGCILYPMMVEGFTNHSGVGLYWTKPDHNEIANYYLLNSTADFTMPLPYANMSNIRIVSNLSDPLLSSLLFSSSEKIPSNASVASFNALSMTFPQAIIVSGIMLAVISVVLFLRLYADHIRSEEVQKISKSV